MAKRRAEVMVKLTFEFDSEQSNGYGGDAYFVRHIIGNQMELEDHDQSDVTVDEDADEYVQVNVEYESLTVSPAE